MKIIYKICDIPGLSWLAELTINHEDIIVYVGKDVGCNEQRFVSGVWDGDFDNSDIISAEFACCSGGVLSKEGEITIFTPSHLQESLYSIKLKNTFYISNSLAFLLAHTELELDENYYSYEYDLCSGLFGVKKQIKQTQLKNGYILTLHRYCNINIDANLNYIETTKSQMKFDDYEDYYNKVINILRLIHKNATSPKRKYRYAMISTISQGYDAPATSVLVKNIGCNEVITFNRPNHYASDCGTEIAKKLGFENIYEENGDKFLLNQDLLEAECCSTGDSGSELIFCAFDNLTSGKLLFMGARGDSIWERLHDNVNTDLDFSNGNTLSQSNLIPYEHFYRCNTIVINVPLIGASAWPDIAKISNSLEMNKWSIRERYDRPICRRILETVGVPRDNFGKIKNGAGISYHFNSIYSLKRKMSLHSYKSFRNWLSKSKCKKIVKLIQYVKFYKNELPIYVNYIFMKCKLSLRIKPYSKSGFVSSPIQQMLFRWSIHEMKKRYQNIK